MASIPQMPYRRPSRQGSRQASIDTRDEIQVRVDHYIGIDVGTGSARACIIDSKGDIVGLASENIGLWQPQQGYYVRVHAQVFLPCHYRKALCGLRLTPCHPGTIYERYLAMHLCSCSARNQPTQH